VSSSIYLKIKSRIFSVSKRIHLPGFEGLPLYDVAGFFFRGLYNGAITTRASSLAFNFFLAVFPSVIFLFTLIPYVPISNFQNTLFELLREIMPKAAFTASEDTITDIIKNQHGGLLSVGFLSALFFSTNGINSMIDGFNGTYHTFETRTLLRQRWISLQLVLITTLLLLIAISIIIYSEILLSRISPGLSIYYPIQLARFLVVYLFFYIVISCYYYLGPASKTGWRFFSAGSTFATVFTLLTSLGFAWFINHFGNYNKLYGSIGTLIILLLWIYFNSIVILLGFELNASIYSAKKTKL
jgi:membrane protein